MAEEYGRLLSAADTLAHVAKALVAVGDKAENAAGAIYLAAAYRPDKLAAYALGLSKSEATFGNGWAWNPTATKVAPRFWELMLVAPLVFDWASGSFAAKASDVIDRDVEGRSELHVSGVRFPRDRVEALWPLRFSVEDTVEAASCSGNLGQDKRPARRSRSRLLDAAEEAKAAFQSLPLDQFAALTINDWESSIIEALTRDGGNNPYKDGSIQKAAAVARRDARQTRDLGKGHSSRPLALQTG